MMSTSGGLNPRAVAGSPSVTRFTQSSCTGMRASGRPRAAVRNILQERERERERERGECVLAIRNVCVSNTLRVLCMFATYMY